MRLEWAEYGPTLVEADYNKNYGWVKRSAALGGNQR